MATKKHDPTELSELEEAYEDYFQALGKWRNIVNSAEVSGSDLGDIPLYKLKKGFALQDMIEALAESDVDLAAHAKASAKAKALDVPTLVAGLSQQGAVSLTKWVDGAKKDELRTLVASALEISEIMENWGDLDWNSVNIFETSLPNVRAKLNAHVEKLVAQAAKEFKAVLDKYKPDADPACKKLWDAFVETFDKEVKVKDAKGLEDKVKAELGDLDLAVLSAAEKKAFDKVVAASATAYLGGLTLDDFKKAHFLMQGKEFAACCPLAKKKKKGTASRGLAPTFSESIEQTVSKLDTAKREQAKELLTSFKDNTREKHEAVTVEDLRTSDLGGLPIGLKNILLESSVTPGCTASAVNVGSRDLADNMAELRRVIQVHDHIAVPLSAWTPESFHHGVVVSNEGAITIANFGHRSGDNGPCINPDGVQLNYHNAPNIVTLAEFCAPYTKRIYLIKHTDQGSTAEINARITQSTTAVNNVVPLFRGNPYSLHTNNCEHYARWVISGTDTPHSYSVSRSWAIGLSFVLVAPSAWAMYTRHAERRFKLTDLEGNLVMRDGVFRRPHRW